MRLGKDPEMDQLSCVSFVTVLVFSWDLQSVFLATLFLLRSGGKVPQMKTTQLCVATIHMF